MNPPVFVNRLLNLRNIKYVGLDMDHTLIRYKTRAFEALVYQHLVDKLIIDKGYPEVIRALEFDFDLAIRGLVIDCENGNILKLSRHSAIRKSRHGTKAIGFDEQKRIYRSHYVDLRDSNYLVVDTTFSIALCVLYSQVVDVKDHHPEAFPWSYNDIAQDIRGCVDELHRNGDIKSIVASHLDQFIHQDEELVKGLLQFRLHGKKIFLLTNSEYSYTKALLDYAITPFLSDDETWEDFFEFVITLAQKPRFFYDDAPFRVLDSQQQQFVSFSGRLARGIYEGGSATKFSRDVGLEGDDILYIGDHIYGDLIRLKKDCNWRTALVVEEMEQEVNALIQSQPFSLQIKELMAQKEPLEQRLLELSTQHVEEKVTGYEAQFEDLLADLNTIDSQISTLIEQQQDCFNAYWGPVFRVGAEESYFAHQVNRFACIYMSRLGDLMRCSPRTYFRASHRPLAHEIAVLGDGS